MVTPSSRSSRVHARAGRRLRSTVQRPSEYGPAAPCPRCRRQAGQFLPGKIAALADAEKPCRRRWTGNSFFAASSETGTSSTSLLGEKKSRPSFRISRSCRKISFSRRNSFGSAARSSCRSGGGALDLVLTALVEPAPQRRKADAEVQGKDLLCVRPQRIWASSTSHSCSGDGRPVDPSWQNSRSG